MIDTIENVQHETAQLENVTVEATPVIQDLATQLNRVLTKQTDYAFLEDDCLAVLAAFPNNSIDCVVTSPPYWKMRDYDVGEDPENKLIGNEKNPLDYVARMKDVFHEIKRVLKPEGSLWLNIGDKYHDKNLMGMPWRVAIAMMDDGWTLRNDIIWDQMKGTQSPKDRLRDVYEHIFHFVKSKKYYYDADSIRVKPKGNPVITEQSTISATGVSGVKYRKQIETTENLTEDERKAAMSALDETLQRLRRGEIIDFRMTIRGVQRTYHGESTTISGRAKELHDKGQSQLAQGRPSRPSFDCSRAACAPVAPRRSVPADS